MKRGLLGGKPAPAGYMEGVEARAKRMDGMKMKKNKNVRVHLLVNCEQTEMFGRNVKRLTACKRVVKSGLQVTCDKNAVTCKRCLKKFAA